MFAFAGLAVAAVLTWVLRVEPVLLFASVLFAVALYVCSQWLAKRTPRSVRAAVAVWYFAGLVLACLLGWIIGVRFRARTGH